MILTCLPDAAALLAEAGDALARDLEREARHSLLLGAALERAAAPASPDDYFAVVRDADGEAEAEALRLVVHHAPPRPLLLAAPAADAGVAPEPALALLADALAAAGRLPEAIHLAEPLAAAFASAVAPRWSSATGREPRLAMRQRLHALAAAAPVPVPAGRMRRAGAADLPLVAEWSVGFALEAMDEMDAERVRRHAAARVEAGEVWLWEAERPRAMAATARRTARTVTLNAVYTPPSERGRGWATGLVAALSARLLGEGAERCVLFTDLANPTSNAIYARIGYRPIGDFRLYRLEPPPGAR